MQWTSDDIPLLKGKTFIVTGANTGIGLATVLALAVKGACVVLACRNVDKGMAALRGIREAMPDANVVVEPLDLASLASVKNFADRMLVNHSRVDVLINNAGVAMPPLSHTEDGFETQFGTNVLGHFALTGHLLPLLAKAPSARVVSMSSIAHWFGRIDFDNLSAERAYSATAAYCQSKLADLVFANELQRRLVRSGATTISLASHPGVTMSELFRHSSIVERVIGLVAQSVTQGALPSLMAATAPSLVGGEYIGPGGLMGLKGLPRTQKSSALARDPVLAKMLWQRAQDMTGVNFL